MSYQVFINARKATASLGKELVNRLVDRQILKQKWREIFGNGEIAGGKILRGDGKKMNEKNKHRVFNELEMLYYRDEQSCTFTE